MSVGPENSVITERLLAATAMKTSQFVHKKLLRMANHTATHLLIELARNPR
ncbi:hypothetical protein BN1184_AD_01990 [Pantoea ananatis]|nr:hypothetical protein BN1182_AE_00220 [Pantoea ananatis]CRH32259.1 hypothetical protein BN1183_AC_02030 [Pantoea ananatis]CRH35923.1 hypothetical protein BN1184_AD_01990 [Pantoea ananatis]